MLAMITTWRWEERDQLPRGRRLATEWLSQIDQKEILTEVSDRGEAFVAEIVTNSMSWVREAGYQISGPCSRTSTPVWTVTKAASSLAR